MTLNASQIAVVNAYVARAVKEMGEDKVRKELEYNLQTQALQSVMVDAGVPMNDKTTWPETKAFIALGTAALLEVAQNYQMFMPGNNAGNANGQGPLVDAILAGNKTQQTPAQVDDQDDDILRFTHNCTVQQDLASLLSVIQSGTVVEWNSAEVVESTCTDGKVRVRKSTRTDNALVIEGFNSRGHVTALYRAEYNPSTKTWTVHGGNAHDVISTLKRNAPAGNLCLAAA